MSQVDFKYNGFDTIIQCNENDKMKDIFEKFCNKSQIDKSKIYFTYDGKSGYDFNEELTFNKASNSLDKQRKKMIILVNKINEINQKNNESIIKSKEIICPECRENTKINIKNYKISLYDCKNGHQIDNLSLDEFEESQKIDLSKIICDKCKEKNKNNVFNKEFYKCFTCNMNLCPLCKSIHDKSHNIINHEQINYICAKHNDMYTNYCKKCKINICMQCNDEHLNHENIFLGNIISNKKDMLNKIYELKENIDIFKNNIDNIINMLNDVKNRIDRLYKIKEDLINNYEIKNRNYELLFNLKMMNDNNDILKDLNKINNEYNIINKFYYIFNIYNKIKKKVIKNNEIKLVLNIGKEDINKDIYFLKGSYLDSDSFEYGNECLNNLDESNCELYINNIKNKFQKYFRPEKEGIYNIRIKFNNQIEDCSGMFYECYNLINIDLSSFDTENVTNMKCMFSKCKNLENIDLSSFDTKNVIDMSEMFNECKKLVNIDLSSFNTSKVTNMNGILINVIIWQN